MSTESKRGLLNGTGARNSRNGGRNGKPDSSTDRRQEIIDAAARVFSERGYSGATVQQIADEVGILKGSLYHYISRKDDLLGAVIDEIHELSTSSINENRNLGGTPGERLRAFMTAHLHWALSDLPKFTVLLNDLDALNNEHRKRIVREQAEYSDYMASLIAEGQEDGVFWPQLKPKVATRALLGMLNWAPRWMRVGTESEISTVIDQFTLITFHGLQGTPSEEIDFE